jgi:UDP-glucose 4-epimerase
MRKILIFGGSGFIGGYLIENLIVKGYTIYILLNHENKNEYLKKKDGIRIVYGKIDNVELIKSIIENEAIDEVLHLVSNIISSSNYHEYLIELKTIIFPTLELIPFLSKKRVKIIYFSSGGAIYGDSNNNELKESDPVSPISYYGLSKLIIEEAIKTESRKSNLSFLIFRPSNPYGYNSRLKRNFGLISNCIDKILAYNQRPRQGWSRQQIWSLRCLHFA